MEKQIKLFTHIIRLLKVDSVAVPFLETPRGLLSLKLVKDKKTFELFLDSVPLDMKDENNQALHARITEYLSE
jgi:hypothetical protein